MCVERGVLLLKINWYNLFRGQHDKYFEQLIPLQERQEPWPDMAMQAISPSSRETEAAESLWLQGHLSIHSEFHSNIVRLKKNLSLTGSRTWIQAQIHTSHTYNLSTARKNNRQGSLPRELALPIWWRDLGEETDRDIQRWGGKALDKHTLYFCTKTVNKLFLTVKGIKTKG